MSLTAKEVAEKISDYEDSSQFEDEGWGNFYETVKAGHWGDEKQEFEVPGLPTIRYIDSYGGEGQGDDYWVVFKCGEQYFRVDGWYASYDGGELDGELYEVFPRQVTSTFYEKDK